MGLIWPWMLATLLVVPPLVLLYLLLLERRRRALVALGPLGVVRDAAARAAGARRHVPPLLYLAALTVMLVALARPEMPVTLPRVEGTVILAFDVSNSMLAADLDPSRVEAAKAAALTFVENQPRTVRLGVVAFGNGGLVVQPPTDNSADVLAAIDRLSPQGGTSLGQGIFAALNAVAEQPIALGQFDPEAPPETLPELEIGDHSSTVIVMLTDGENTSAPDPLEVAQLAAEAGVRIYPVGIGSAEGTVLEVDGFSVLTRLDEGMLRALADVTNGRYYYAEDEAALEEIYQTIDLRLAIRGQKMEVTSFFAAAGALLMLAGGALSMLWFGRVP